MKSIYAFAFFVSMTIGVFPVLSYGQDAIDFTIFKTPYRVSLATGAGVLLGQSEEIVYKNSNTDNKLSQLLWDLKPLVYIGTALSFSRANPLAGLGAVTDLSVKFGLPLLSGTMEDRDWQDSNPDLLTNFSSHDAYIQGAMLLDFSGGIAIPIVSRVVIKVLASFSYMRFSWIARDGYAQYNESGWNSSLPKTYSQGTGISYDQEWLILSPGLGLFWPFYRSLNLDFRFFISPLIFANDLDNHFFRDPNAFGDGDIFRAKKSERYLQFTDHTRDGIYLEPSLNLTFSPNPYLSLLFHGSWRYISGVRGDTYTLKTGPNTTTPFKDPNSAGVGYSAFDLGLFLKIALPLGRLSKKN
ncbi:omptin family outer membrane protease [Treponema primitia]|uniref:omptin family outer membrane protease n=1 Tax=Treponema primitia TaxID=88058 RepID=UPI00397FF462